MANDTLDFDFKDSSTEFITPSSASALGKLNLQLVIKVPLTFFFLLQ